ncbi:MAG: FeoA family protein [Dehalococcoidia bacterium]
MAKPQGERLSLAELKIGQIGSVVEVRGGPGLIRRLDALGIRRGKKVTKLSSTLFRGPVILRVDNAQVAVGFGMAKRIIVQVDKYLPRPS